MNLIGIDLPDFLRQHLCSLYPEHSWHFPRSGNSKGFLEGMEFNLGNDADTVVRSSTTLVMRPGRYADFREIADAKGLPIALLQTGPFGSTPGILDCWMALSDSLGKPVLDAADLLTGEEPASGNTWAEISDPDDDALPVAEFLDLIGSNGTPSGRRTPPEIHMEHVRNFLKTLKLIPKGNRFCNLSGRTMTTWERVRMQRTGRPFLKSFRSPLHAIEAVDTVITDSIILAMIARIANRDVIYLRDGENRNKHLHPVLRMSPDDLRAFFAEVLRGVDPETGDRLSCLQMIRTYREQLPLSDEDVPSEEEFDETPHSLVIGGGSNMPIPLASLFEQENGLQAPGSFSIESIESQPEVLADLDYIFFHKNFTTPWLDAIKGSVHLLWRYPCGMPFGLSRHGGFFPVLFKERIVFDAGRGDGPRMDLASEIDALDDDACAHYKQLAVQMRPNLTMLQNTWCPDYQDVFTIMRKLRMTEFDRRRVLVLGHGSDVNELINTNPHDRNDHEIIAKLLISEPDVEVIYQPSTLSAGDEVLMGAIRALGKRVVISPRSFNVDEFSPLVEAVHTIDSTLGIAALASNLPLFVYGAPFYAGLGATVDLDGEGDHRTPLAASPVDADTFLGWFFTEKVIFVDPIDGSRISFDQFIGDWFCKLGDLPDAVADRLVDTAAKSSSIDFVITAMNVLQRHAKRDHARRMISAFDIEMEARQRTKVALSLTPLIGWAIDWKSALACAAQIYRIRGSQAVKDIAATLPDLRNYARTKEESEQFGAYLLIVFRDARPEDLEVFADALSKGAYFNAASHVYSGLMKTDRILVSLCRCNIKASHFGKARRAITSLVARGASADTIEDLELELCEMSGKWSEALVILDRKIARSEPDTGLLQRYATACERNGDLDEALDTMMSLVSSKNSEWAVRSAVQLLIGTMRIDQAKAMLEAYLDSGGHSAAALKLMGDCLSYQNDLQGAGDFYFRAQFPNPVDGHSLSALLALFELEKELVADDAAPDILWSDRWAAILDDVRHPTVPVILSKCRCRLNDNDPDTIHGELMKAIDLYPNDLRTYVWAAHTMAWSKEERTPERIEQIKHHYNVAFSIGKEDNWWTFYDFIRSMAFLGEKDEIRRVLTEQKSKILESHKYLTGWPQFVAGTALSDLDLAFGGLRHFGRTLDIRRHARNFRVVESIEEIEDGESVLFLSEGGVGDELRYATIYPELSRRFPEARFTVDERLAPLFRRSFTDVAEFLPLRRYHRYRLNAGMEPDISDLPHRDMIPHFNNEIWHHACSVDVVAPVANMMLDLRPDIASFEAGPLRQLVPDPELVAAWRERLRPYEDDLLVGIIGSSMILEYQRIANYFTPEEMAPILTMEGVRFVSLEYASASEQNDYIEKKFGAEILDFDDLDRKDDFDGVLALCHALDCVVGVNTAATELTGFGGIETFFAAPNMQHAWRSPWESGRDLFFPSTHVEMSRTPAGKLALSGRIAEKLLVRRDAKAGTGETEELAPWA